MSTEADLIRGLVYTHNRANANMAEVHQAAATVQAVVETLVERGVLDRDALEARHQETAHDLRRCHGDRGMPVAMREFGISKYDFQDGASIDCESRLALCNAACCRLPFALSTEDVREGIVHWDLGRPYIIAQDAQGYCVHLDHGAGRRSIFAQRPVPCRGYDWRRDKRIWPDFESRSINLVILDPDWPACLQADPQSRKGEEA